MSLDVTLTELQPVSVYSANITHNLTTMAMEAGIYAALWKPEQLNITKAKQLIPFLTEGLERLEAEPDKFKLLDSPNGWGKYEYFVPFVRKYLRACIDNPDAYVSVST